MFNHKEYAKAWRAKNKEHIKEYQKVYRATHRSAHTKVAKVKVAKVYNGKSPPDYRKLYEKHYGPIPREPDGRSYHIHHIDGLHSNNHPANLKAVTVQEHFDIHYEQADWYACAKLSGLLGLSSKDKSEIARQSSLQRLANGTHHFLKQNRSEEFEKRTKEATAKTQSIRNKKLIAEGKHPFQNPEVKKRSREQVKISHQERLKNGTHNFQDPEFTKRRNERLANGTHNFQTPGFYEQLSEQIKLSAREQLANGTHNSQRIHTCPHCNKTGKGNGMFKHHFDRCKFATQPANDDIANDNICTKVKPL